MWTRLAVVCIPLFLGAVAFAGQSAAASRSHTWAHPEAAAWGKRHREDVRGLERGLSALMNDLHLCAPSDPRSICQENVGATAPNPEMWSWQATSVASSLETTISVARLDGPIPSTPIQHQWSAALGDLSRGCAATITAVQKWNAATPADGAVTIGPSPAEAAANLIGATHLLRRVSKNLMAKR